MYEAVRRLRRWAEKQKLPLTVQETEGAYRLGAHAPCALRLPPVEARADKHQPYLDVLRKRWGETPFTLPEAAGELGLTYRTAHRVFEELLAKGRIVRSGKGRNTRYRLALPETRKAA